MEQRGKQQSAVQNGSKQMYKDGMEQWGKQQSAAQTGSLPAPAGAPADRRQYHWVLDRIAEHISQPRPEYYIDTLSTHKLYREGKKLDKFTIRMVNNLQSKYVQMYQECIKYMLRTELKIRPSAEEVYLRLKNKKFFFGSVAVRCYQCDNGSVKLDDSYGDWEWDHLDDIIGGVIQAIHLLL